LKARKIAAALTALGTVLLLGGGSWFLLGERSGKGEAILAAGVGFAGICFSQAVYAFGRRIGPRAQMPKK
jgi:drug/metabolite transporter (DMT)-like permease